jgi:hypothetical protein
VKVGAKSSKKTWIAIGLTAIAVIMTVRMISGSFSSSEAAAPATTTVAKNAPRPPKRATGNPGRNTAKKEQHGPVTPNLDPRLQLGLLNETENTEYTGAGRNIFKSQGEDVVKIPNPVASAIRPPTPPTPVVVPPPPPINLKFFGFASQQGSKRIFLSAGDDIIVASEGEIVQRRYRIVKINPTSIEVEDVLNNNRQTIPLTQA